MTAERRYYVVDRLEGSRAVLIPDGPGEPVELPLAALPFRVREAMVLAVPLDARGNPRWDRAERDEAEERRRLAEGKARLERLKRRDPGGDVTL
jgi:Protein of unknown function (DUF3006)